MAPLPSPTRAFDGQGREGSPRKDGDWREVVVKNTFIHVEDSPRSPAARPYARRCKTAPEALLAACVGAELPSHGPSTSEELASTRASSSRTIAFDPDDTEHAAEVGSSSASVCTMSSSLSLGSAFSDFKKKFGGIKNLSGKRPGKKARMQYQHFAESVEEMVRADSSLSLETIELPAFVRDNDMLRAKLAKRMETIRLAVGGTMAPSFVAVGN
jgi:hypothetical protein